MQDSEGDIPKIELKESRLTKLDPIIGKDTPSLIRDLEVATRRDVSLIILRHGEELRDGDPNSPLSEVGRNQSLQAANDIIRSLSGIEEGIAIKIYTSPKPWSEETAQIISQRLHEAKEEGELPENIIVLKAREKIPIPRRRKAIDRDFPLTSGDLSTIKSELKMRRDRGEKVDVSDIWYERSTRGLLESGSATTEDVERRIKGTVERFEKLADRIGPKGEKLFIVLVSHNAYFFSLLDRNAEGCDGMRIDLPLVDNKRAVLIAEGLIREL